MRLRTLVGPHAGEVRDYSFIAARAALEAGMAEPLILKVGDVEPVAAEAQVPTSPPSPEGSAWKGKRPKR